MEINKVNYSNFVEALVKTPVAILYDLDSQKIDLWHMATGISGEAGELLDAIKKYVVYNKPLDIKNVIEELGDLEFYMEFMRNRLGITREQVIQANIDKLSIRYASLGYSDSAAHARADKIK